MDSILAPWIVEMLLLNWRGWHNHGRLAYPSEILATFVVFGGASFIGNKKIGAYVGWGFVVATFLNAAPSLLVPSSLKGGSSTVGPINPAAGGPTKTVTGSKPVPGVNVNPSTGTGY